MILSVVFPHLQKAQWERIDEEFKHLEYEVIIQSDTQKAIDQAKGKFILFLERDAAINKGEFRKTLDAFLDNPSYRKLAMVTSGVDFEQLPEPIRYTADDGLVTCTNVTGDTIYPVQIGYLYGSIIRKSALAGVKLPTKQNAVYQSIYLSDLFWSKGLRIEINPLAVYYAPVGSNPIISKPYKLKASSESVKVWNKEFIP